MANAGQAVLNTPSNLANAAVDMSPVGLVADAMGVETPRVPLPQYASGDHGEGAILRTTKATQARSIGLAEFSVETLGPIGAEKALGSLATKFPTLAKFMGAMKCSSGVDDVGEGLSKAHLLVDEAQGVEDAGTSFRRGGFAGAGEGWDGNYVKGLDWSQGNPLATPDFVGKYGLPEGNSSLMPDWVAGGHIVPDAGAVSYGAAPGIESNVGGAMDVSVSPMDVVLHDGLKLMPAMNRCGRDAEQQRDLR